LRVLAGPVLAGPVLAGAVLAGAVLAPGAAAGGVIGGVIGGSRLAGPGVVVDDGAGRALPSVQASAFVVADAGTGQVLAAKDPHGWYRPASTLKMLTAVALIPLLNPDATVVASKQATSAPANVAGLITGHAYRISDLFTALLTISANDAAVALTQATGSFGRGMAAINAEARQLRADDTVAVEPNGLDAPGQHTSAYDLALIARQALRQPAFMKYDETTAAKFAVSAKKSVTLVNQNSLLTSYPGGIGGKIGWTSAAGATYVGMARRHGVTLIVTLLHCPALTEIDTAKKLLNWGFAVDGKVRAVGTLVSALPSGGAGSGFASASASASAPASASGFASGFASASGSAAGAVRSGAAGARAAGGGSGLVGGHPSVVAAGFSCVALIVAGLGFAHSRRRLGFARSRRPPPSARNRREG
jgi:D-alanyl-D-alanine carboxypeptidase (penicillin-binding protein 5/6)